MTWDFALFPFLTRNFKLGTRNRASPRPLPAASCQHQKSYHKTPPSQSIFHTLKIKTPNPFPRKNFQPKNIFPPPPERAHPCVAHASSVRVTLHPCCMHPGARPSRPQSRMRDHAHFARKLPPPPPIRPFQVPPSTIHQLPPPPLSPSTLNSKHPQQFRLLGQILRWQNRSQRRKLNPPVKPAPQPPARPGQTSLWPNIG